MFRVQWHRLFRWHPFPKKISSAVNYFSKRLQSKQKPSDSESFWSKMFGKYLIVTNTVGSGLLLGIGDAVSQYWDRLEDKKSFDYLRSGNMVITGFIIGPVQHGFYSLLDRIFIGNTTVVVLKKLLLDHLIMSPTYIVLFFYITSLLEGLSIKECNSQLSEMFFYIWALDCLFFPALQYLNFRYFTDMHRVVYINLVNCSYVVMLSYFKYSQINSEK